MGFFRDFIFEKSYPVFISSTSARRGFAASSLACRHDANDLAFGTLTVTDNQQLRVGTHSEHDEALVNVRVLIIKEDGLGFLERDLMLLEVCGGLEWASIGAHT